MRGVRNMPAGFLVVFLGLVGPNIHVVLHHSISRCLSDGSDPPNLLVGSLYRSPSSISSEAWSDDQDLSTAPAATSFLRRPFRCGHVAKENPARDSFSPSRPIGHGAINLLFLPSDQTQGLIQWPLSLNHRKFCFWAGKGGNRGASKLHHPFYTITTLRGGFPSPIFGH